MSSLPLPYLLETTPQQEKVDRLGWTVGHSFAAYGMRFGLRANDVAACDEICAAVPFGWQMTSAGEVKILYSLRLAQPSTQPEIRNDHLLYCGSALIARARDLASVLEAFTRHAELLTAFWAQDCLFVHAGVVGWQGRAIIIPGRSMTGKTTLVKALVEAGATYYSDEFAVLDQHGWLHSYPLPLSLRGAPGQPSRKTPVEALGGLAGVDPLPVGLIAVIQYQAGARWQPVALTPSQALLALMDNTVAARRAPSHSMPILREAVLGAVAVQSLRSEASRVARRLLGLVVL